MKPIHRKWLLSLGAIWWCCIGVFAQEQQSYKGPMKVGNYMGNAQYQYRVIGQDTLFDGAFQVQRSSLEALLEGEDASFLFKGNFEGGLPTDSWQFQFGEFQTDSQSEVVDYEYRVLISGLQEAGSGTLAQGRPDGPWRYEVNRIKDSEVAQRLFTSVITFQNGVPQQNFQIENEKATLVGRFLRNGLAHDEWTSYTTNVLEDVESWFFEEGVLRNMVVVKDGLRQEIKVFDTLSNGYTTIPLDKAYLEMLRATLKLNGRLSPMKSGISDLLDQNEAYYRKVDTVLSQLGATDFYPEFQVKVPYFPMDTTQKAQLKTISENFEKARTISESLLKNSHLNIVKRSDSEALYRYNTVTLIKTQFLDPLEQLVSYGDLGILEYIDLGGFIETLWPTGKPDPQLVVLMDGTANPRTFALTDAAQYDFGGNDWASMVQLSTYATRSLEEIKEALSDQLTNEERRQQLNGLEEDLIALNEALVQRIDTTLSQLPEEFSDPLENIKALAEASLGQYATMENAEKKLRFGTELKACFEHLTALAATLIALPEQMDEIRLLYQDSIWNPFMATVMDEEVKRRITAAYFNVLIPHFLDQITKDLSCDNAEKSNNQIIHANERITALREEDTRRLERKLRKEKDAEMILQLIHSQTTVKEK